VLKELLTTPKSFVQGAWIKADGSPVGNSARDRLGTLLPKLAGKKVEIYATR
jgi:hypothetical protein